MGWRAIGWLGAGACVIAVACGTGSDSSPRPSPVGAVCGNGTCDRGENAANCPQDCPCGDGTCKAGETPASCPIDCPAVCGDGACTIGEDPTTCSEDCGTCGNDVCDPGEDLFSCFMDCHCGNGICEYESPDHMILPLEDHASCPADCYCGNGSCDWDEQYGLCWQDCCLDLAPLVGATAQCGACAAQWCCDLTDYFWYRHEYGGDDAESFAELRDCATSIGNPCGEICVAAVCAGDVWSNIYMSCGDCLSAHCCASWTPCESDATCLDSCIFANPTATPACCADGSLFKALDDCQAANCATECDGSSCAGDGPPPGAFTPSWSCGDDVCAGDETAASCPHDCFCGNNTCEPSELGGTCPSDCPCNQNHTCDSGEDGFTCPADCACAGGGGPWVHCNNSPSCGPDVVCCDLWQTDCGGCSGVCIFGDGCAELGHHPCP